MDYEKESDKRQFYLLQFFFCAFFMFYCRRKVHKPLIKKNIHNCKILYFFECLAASNYLDIILLAFLYADIFRIEGVYTMVVIFFFLLDKYLLKFFAAF